jgi:ribonuclease-3
MKAATDLNELQAALCYRFQQPQLLVQALVHRSFVNENASCAWSDNETLEFLGDAVLGLAVSQLLWRRYPDYNEGDLSRLRSAIVNEKELARVARELDLGGYMYLGKGEESTGGRDKPSLLANTLEAVLAAVFLDGGLEMVDAIVERFFGGYLSIGMQEHPLDVLDKDYKTQLQEFTQSHFKITPLYLLEEEEGPDHDKVFTMSVAVLEQIVARGTGKSKKAAQQQAAKRALERLMLKSRSTGGG